MRSAAASTSASSHAAPSHHQPLVDDPLPPPPPQQQPAVVVLPDAIVVTQLQVRMVLGVDNWERTSPQPVHITARLHTDVSRAGASDQLPYSIHYGTLVKALEKHCAQHSGIASTAASAAASDRPRYRSVEALAEALAKVCLFTCHAPRVTLRVEKPRSLLHARSAGVELVRTPDDYVLRSPGGAAGGSVTGAQLLARDAAEAARDDVQSRLELAPDSAWAAHDKVLVTDLTVSAILGVNPWERVDRQQVVFNLVIYSGLERLRRRQAHHARASAAATATATTAKLEGAAPAPAPVDGGIVTAVPVDRVTRPQNYRTIVRSITRHVEASAHKTVESLATAVARVAVRENGAERVRVRVDKPSAIMFARAAGVEVERDRSFFEREAVGEDAARAAEGGGALLRSPSLPPQPADTLPSVSSKADATVEDARRRQLEEQEPQQPSTSQRAVASAAPTSSSPSAPAAANGHATSAAGVAPSAGDAGAETWHVAAIALGSNLGDRVANIERALHHLENSPGVILVDTSFLYQTKPMYHLDQPAFLNAACRIATTLTPHKLLELTQSIEVSVGRDKRGVPPKGPRVVDLDLIFYDRLELDDAPRLVLPHPGLAEREFVLRPLADILPDYQHPTGGRSVSQMLSLLCSSEQYEERQRRNEEHVEMVLPIPPPRAEPGEVAAAPSEPPGEEARLWAWGGRTWLMGIINATPDSFSDGGENLAPERAAQTAHRMVCEEGADMLDVGGMSTAPGAPEIAPEEEARRVVDVVRAIRARGGELATVPISVDTFRAGVAREALRAGANVINDVSGGTREPAILRVAREWRVPLVLMHMRGDSRTMTALSAYAGGDVVGGVATELAARVEGALRCGVRRWSMVLDPGIGFAKDVEGNLDLIRGLTGLRDRDPSPVSLALPAQEAAVACVSPHASLRNFPLLLGVSRKRFLATITQRGEATTPTPAKEGDRARADAKRRVYATAAACTAAVAGGCDVLRVHDVGEMWDVARTADAIYRPRLRAGVTGRPQN